MYENVPRIKEAVRLIWGEEDIVPPGVVLLNDRPEFYALKRERLWAAMVPVVGGVGRPQLEIDNPVVPGGLLVVVVTSVRVVAPVAGIYDLMLDAAIAGAPTANISRDPRNSGIQSKNRILNTLPKSGTQLDQLNAIVNVDASFTALPVILTQGHRLDVFGVNTTGATAIFTGYEFNARAEELAI